MADFIGDTIAGSIQMGNLAWLGWQALAALRQWRGPAAALSDDEILAARFLNGCVGKQTAEEVIKEL